MTAAETRAETSILRKLARSVPYARELRAILLGAVESRLAVVEERLATLERGRGNIDQALAASSDFWRAYDRPAALEKGPILVDLMHFNGDYLWRSLVLGKLLQFNTGAPLVALLGRPGVTDPHNPADNAGMARALGVTEFINVPDEDAHDNYETPALKTIIDLATSLPDGVPLPPSAIVRLREVRTKAGFPIGRCVLETFMRAELEARVLAGPRLVHWAKRVLGFVDFAEQLIGQRHPSAFVTGHVDYCPWGALAELLVRRGGRVVYFREECRMPIHIIEKVDAGRTINGMIRKAEQESFSEFERRIAGNSGLTARIDALAQGRSDAVRKGVGRHHRWVAPNSFSPAPVPRAIFANGALPLYVLFAHTFTDQPAADDALFVDYLEWVEETCRHAAATRAYNLIVKVHPFDHLYDRSGAIDRIAAAFADAENLHFTRDRIDPKQLAELCALGITVRGTPGLEMTELGLPMLLAGHSFYSDSGFCLAPRSRAEYFGMLAQGPPFPIDIGAQSLRCRRYRAFDRYWSAPATPLVPAFNAMAMTDQNLWALIGEGVRCACLETDQVARATAQAWSKGSTKVVAPELEELLAGRP